MVGFSTLMRKKKPLVYYYKNALQFQRMLPTTPDPNDFIIEDIPLSINLFLNTCVYRIYCAEKAVGILNAPHCTR